MKEFEYPMWFKSLVNEYLIVKFNGLTDGIIVGAKDKNTIGYCEPLWKPHTDANTWINVTDQYKDKTTIPPLKMCGTPKRVHGMPYDSESGERKNEVIRPKVSHYQGLGIEPIDYINSHNFNFNLGNAIKYISRCGKKEGESVTKDLQKAIDYLTFEILRVNNVEK